MDWNFDNLNQEEKIPDNLTPEEQQATVHGIAMPNKDLYDNFRDARIRFGVWLQQNMCSFGAEPDYTREARLEGLREFQKRFNEVLVAALKVRPPRLNC